MSAQIHMLRKFRCQNLLVRRSMPTLFIVVCFFIIANSRCDSVGSANVQKFHPNGRYGRRSVSSLVDQTSHTEYGKLSAETSAHVITDQRDPLKSLLHSFDANYSKDGRGNNFFPPQQIQSQNVINGVNNIKDDLSDASGMRSNLEQELTKLLRCNYTGVSNLYWCDTGN